MHKFLPLVLAIFSLQYGCGYLEHLGTQRFCPANQASSGEMSFAQRVGDSNDNQTAESVSVDPDGNLFVSGTFVGTLPFGSKQLSADSLDGFVVKLDPNGNALWQLQLAGPNDTVSLGVSTDTDGGALVTGYFTGHMTIGGIMLSAGANNQADLFLAKINSDGTVAWAKHFGDLPGSQQGWIARRAPDDAIVLAGYYRGTINFGDGVLPDATQWNVFITKLESDASRAVWSRAFGTAADESTCRSMDIDNAGNILISGQFTGPIMFGNNSYTTTGSTDKDAFAVRISPFGNVLSSKVVGGAGEQQGRKAAFTSTGNIVMAGWFSESADFGCASPLTTAGSTDTDSYVAEFSDTGTCIWQRAFGDSAVGQYATALSVDDNDRVIVGGQFAGGLSLGNRSIAAQSPRDAFVAKFDSDGTSLWAYGFGASNVGADTFTNNITNVIADSCNGRVYATGTLQANAQIPLTTMATRTDHDALILGFNP